jgi:hypothetical protein
MTNKDQPTPVAGDISTTPVWGVFYLWGSKAFGTSIATHTYVTNYNSTPACPINIPFPDDYFWYCWGDCHTWPWPATNPWNTPDSWAVANRWGDNNLAANLNLPNIEGSSYTYFKSHGGINGFYGWRGVCHQVANRTLYATYWQNGGANIDPMVIPDSVLGYGHSVWAYGRYGRGLDAEFSTQITNAGGDPTYVDNYDDDIERVLKASLGIAYSADHFAAFQNQKATLHALMDELGARVQAGDMSIHDYAVAINNKATEIFHKELIPLIGNEAYQKAFNAHPDLPIELIDLNLAKKADLESK